MLFWLNRYLNNGLVSQSSVQSQRFAKKSSHSISGKSVNCKKKSKTISCSSLNIANPKPPDYVPNTNANSLNSNMGGNYVTINGSNLYCNNENACNLYMNNNLANVNQNNLYANENNANLYANDQPNIEPNSGRNMGTRNDKAGGAVLARPPTSLGFSTSHKHLKRFSSCDTS